MKRLLPLLTTFLLFSALLGCSTDDPAAKTELGIRIASLEGCGLTFPVEVYLFDEEGARVDRQSLADPDGMLRFWVPAGQRMRVAAVCRNEDYLIPEDPVALSQITIPGGCSATPLVMGFADFVAGTATTSLLLQMAPQTASLDISISDMPSDIECASVGIGSVYGSLSLMGQGGGMADLTLPLRRDVQVWTLSATHLFPSIGSRWRFSVQTIGPQGSAVVGTVCTSPLLAGRHHHIEASYRDLGGIGTGDTSDIVIDGDSAIRVERWPEAGSIFQGHVVALVDSVSPQKARLTLLSLWDWNSLPSANNAEQPTLALDMAAAYIEGDLEHWSIPSKIQAQALKAAYDETSLDTLNRLFRSLNAMEILIENGSSNVRYLCEEASKSFCFKSGTAISNAGSASHDYHMRLVRTLEVRRP